MSTKKPEGWVPKHTRKLGVHKGEGSEVFNEDQFYDMLVWEEIVASKDGRPLYRKWRFEKSAFPCPSCAQTSDIQFNIQKVGVFYRCQYCNVTQPASPVNSETNQELASLLLEKYISVDKALKIFSRISILPPEGIRGIRAGERRQKRTQKRQLV